jgi:hypothetical protein
LDGVDGLIGVQLLKSASGGVVGGQGFVLLGKDFKTTPYDAIGVIGALDEPAAAPVADPLHLGRHEKDVIRLATILANSPPREPLD